MITQVQDITNILVAKIRNQYGDDVLITDTPYSRVTVEDLVVSIVPISNVVNTRYSTFTHFENVVRESFEVNVYSNDEERKTEIVLEVATMIADICSTNYWERTMFSPTPNLSDETIARHTSRYTKIL